MKKQKIKKCRATLFAVIAILIVLSSPPAQYEEPETTGYISVNGLDYYYEIHGEGDRSAEASEHAEPLFLLHGHGRTELGDRPPLP
ncbi:hypothetical protein SAMN05443144_113125 [Fodinibius roseus]|uniref:Alpha/beta hydrolase family protein n=1 Tax=Fodinibius roseus TaxID=1194090 RepID=A0A1M5EQ65_9BACT|nr:hypothetical protein [Fodinibius roseus]SHF81172.1 hypothetical protein SAMN05443144_113125 [Fodinibius roseus]